VSQKTSQIWQAGVSTSTDKFLINFSKQHQQTFKYDTRIQLSLFLHFYLLYLLLNSCDKMMRHRRLAAALTDTWTTISHHRRIKDLKLTATDYQSNLKSKKQKKTENTFVDEQHEAGSATEFRQLDWLEPSSPIFILQQQLSTIRPTSPIHRKLDCAQRAQPQTSANAKISSTSDPRFESGFGYLLDRYKNVTDSFSCQRPSFRQVS